MDRQVEGHKEDRTPTVLQCGSWDCWRGIVSYVWSLQTEMGLQVEPHNVAIDGIDIGRIVDELAIRANVDVVCNCRDRRSDGSETESND